MARAATAEDRAALLELYEICFPDDPPGFRRWVKEERMERSKISVVECEGRIVSAVHALPQKLMIRGVPVDGALIGFAGTVPEYRRLGFMKEAMGHCMQTLRERGAILAAFTPRDMRAYYKLGMYPIADAKFMILAPEVARPQAGDIIPFDISADAGAIFSCYEKFSKGYSVMTSRSYHDFAFKCADYIATGDKCIVSVGDNGLDGYCIYNADNEYITEELVALNQSAYERLCYNMAWMSKGRRLTLKLDPRVEILMPGSELRIPRWTAIGVVNAERLLSTVVGIKKYAIELTDKCVPENAGVFNFDGERVDAKPSMSTETAYLAQWLLGYKSFEELYEEGNMKIYDPRAAAKLDVLDKYPCYIMDEY